MENPVNIITDTYFVQPTGLGKNDISPILEELDPVNDILHEKVNVSSEGVNIAATLTDDDKVEAILHSQLQYNYMIGCVYRHFKGHVYKVISISINTETLEPDISYQRVDGTSIDRNIIWTRKLSMFLEPVDKTKYPDADQEMRFQKI